MINIRRRRFLKIAGASALASGFPRLCLGAVPHIVVVGGGAAGTVAARQLAAAGSAVEVTLIEQQQRYHSSLACGRILSGMDVEGRREFGYEAIRAQGINVVHDVVEAIDAEQRAVTLGSGNSLSYDRLILAPGLSLDASAISGYDADAAALMPHAWPDREQTRALRMQIEGLRQGGTFLITVPAGPVSSRAAPYERASHVAHYLKQHNPTAKVLICDTKTDFPMSPLFRAAWNELYPGMVEWVSGSDTGGEVTAVDAGAMKVIFPKQTFSADVANIVPPQIVGELAAKAGVRDSGGWCPVDMTSFESVLQPGIHVIGDATLVNGLPKCAQIANSQAKICARAILTAFTGVEAGPVRFIDVDYSIVGADYAFASVSTYAPAESGDGVVRISSTQSSVSDSRSRRSREYAYAMSWYNNISQEMFG